MREGIQGVVHLHSTNSFDGKLTYAELKEFLSSKGVHFACMTEHIEELDQAAIDNIVAGCREASDDTFLFIPGIEMDCFTIYFLGIDDVTVDFTSNETIFRSLREVAQLCIFAHPIKAGWKYPQWLIDLCDGVEIWNVRYDGRHVPRGASERLYGRVRAERPDAVAVGGIDFHSQRDFFPLVQRLDQAGPLTEEFVIGELKAGRFTLYREGVELAKTGGMTKFLGRLRIRLMDCAHAVHRGLGKMGIRIPKSLKRAARRLTEG